MITALITAGAQMITNVRTGTILAFAPLPKPNADRGLCRRGEPIRPLPYLHPS